MNTKEKEVSLGYIANNNLVRIVKITTPRIGKVNKVL